jgi:hypothetical protein
MTMTWCLPDFKLLPGWVASPVCGGGQRRKNVCGVRGERESSVCGGKSGGSENEKKKKKKNSARVTSFRFFYFFFFFFFVSTMVKLTMPA